MDERPNYYSILTADVRYDELLRPNEKLLFSEITALAYRTGECWASNNYFSKLYSVKPNAIATWLRHLKERNYISINYIYNGKQIEKRIIKIGGIQKNMTSYPNEYVGDIQKDMTYSQKGEDNIKTINITSINNKNIYGEYKNVKLTNQEYEKLKSEYKNVDDLIKFLDEYIEMKGYKAKSHYLCIKKWVVKAVEDQRKKDFWNE